MESDKGGHGLDADLGRDLVLDIDINFVEVDLFTGRRIRDLLEDRSDDFAGTAPCGPEVNDDGLLSVDLSSRQSDDQ